MTRRALRARVLLPLALMLSTLVGGLPSVAAQTDELQPDFFVSELSDIEVEISGSDFEIYDAELQSFEHGEGEIIQIASDTAFVQLAFYDDTDTNAETMELYNLAFSEDVDDFEVLDEVDRGAVVSTFAVATVNDAQYLYYLSVTEDVVGNVDLLQRVYAPDSAFFTDFAAAQDAITIDGDPLLQDVDVADLETLAEGAVDTGARESDPDEDATQEADDDRDRDQDEEPERGTTGGEDAYAFEIVPAELTVSGDVTLSDSFYQEPVTEQVQLELGSAGSFALVQLMQSPMDAEASLDFFLGTFSDTLDSVENLGSDADATSAWSLDVVQSGPDTAVVYILVDGERYDGFHYVELIFSTEATILDDISTLNRDVAVDGEGMFSAADVDAIESLLNGEEAPVDPEEETGDSGRRVDAKIDTGEGEDEGTDSRDRTRERDRDDEGSESSDSGSALDLESQGLVSESEFESLQYGPVVEWDETVWSVDPEWELSAVSDPETGVDSVILFWANGNASMMVQIMSADGSTPADFVEAWESDDYITSAVHEDAEVLLSDSGRSSGATAYLTFDEEGNELILVQEVLDLDGGDTVALVTMFGAPTDVADAYGEAGDLVSIDGGEIVGTFTPRELEGAIGQ